MSLTSLMAEERRQIVLAALAEASGFQMNEDSVRIVLRAIGHNVTSDVMRGDLKWLSEVDLIRLDHVPVAGGELWIAHLRQMGQDVANGAHFPGVARPRAV